MSAAPNVHDDAPMYAMWSGGSHYRRCPREQVETHAAGVVSVETSQHRDAWVGVRKYMARVQFDDGTFAEMTTLSLKARDEFAADFSLRIRRPAA